MEKKLTWPEPSRDTIALNGQFHKTFEIEELTGPGIPLVQTIFVRIQLIGGELSELAAGLAATRPDMVLDALTDIQYVLDGTYRTFGMGKLKQQHECLDFPVKGCADAGQHTNIMLMASLNKAFGRLIEKVGACDTIAIARALNDFQFQLDYGWRTLGFMHVKFFAYAEVHRSNMTKLDAVGRPIKFPSGKIGKGPFFEEPNLAPFLSDNSKYPWNQQPWLKYRQ